ncbi:phage portal protein [Brevibacillus borstelensis]|uniref:phage portal protein n=1 Tax=Brevibacillus borstelensis TaxID=45462 RepID=UPI000F07D1E8|nr:phage portal protein [Brevibacillus borstelensis]MED1881997.1 phage portal protein [Brevibacillus borstelensis]RNB56109.1 phage portal protein [Brevibacillus borstelensis]GED55567.1 phage-like element PBSX protein XkdE [Brevibacillus borstelensis]
MSNATGWYPIGKAEIGGESQQIITDQFEQDYDEYKLIRPSLDPLACVQVVKQSNIIPQCVEAYKTNVTGYGYALEYLPGQSDDTAKAEWDVADRFMQTANLEESVEQLLSQLVEDLEHCGNAYIEVARGGGLPAIYRIPPEYMRCTAPLEKVEMKYLRLVQGKVEEFTQSKWVRRYAQKRGTSITWFREFGAPGEGNEVIHLQLGNGTYGEPRWSGNSPGVVGSRKAEELNLDYFDNGRMLAMILTVMNGELAPQSIEALKGAKGKKSQGGILYLEVQGYDKGLTGDEKEKTSIKLDKLNDLLQQDALFLEYNREKRKETRSAFRVPPILTGESDDYNRATSDNARRIAEEQVFQPYRKWLMDEIFNKRLLPSIGVYRVKAILRSPKISDPDERKAMLDYLADRGLLFVRDLIPIAEEVLGTVIDESRYSDGYLDTPIAQLTPAADPFGVPEHDADPEEKLATVAKRLLRETRDRQYV